MAASEGYIKLHRKILHSEMWQHLTAIDRDVLLICLLLASHRETGWQYLGQSITLDPGQFVTSWEKLRQRCAPGTTITNVRTAFRHLKNWEFLTWAGNKQNSKQGNKQGMLVTVCNWDRYQKERQKPNKQANKPANTFQEITKKTKGIQTGIDPEITAARKARKLAHV